MAVRVISPPEPLAGLAEAKLHLRVDAGDEDALITSFIEAASEHIDGPAAWLGRAIGIQTLEASHAGFCERSIRLPCPPVLEIISVSYMNSAGASQTIDPADYSLSDDRLRYRDGFEFPATASCDAVRVRYKAGYAVRSGDGGDWVQKTPAPIKVAVLMHIGLLYANRESAADSAYVLLPTGYEALLSPFRIWSS